MRARTITAIVVLGAAVFAVGASADFSSVNDPRGDTTCGNDGGFKPKPCSDSKRRNADIVRATAGHDGALLKHRIRVVGKFHAVELLINTDSDPECEFVVGSAPGYPRYPVEECAAGGRATGPARYEFHRHSIEISFSEESIGNPDSYGWQVSTESLGKDYLHADAHDSLPNGGGYIQHRLR